MYLFLAFAAAAISAAQPVAESPLSPETLAIAQDGSARMTLQAEVNGRGPYRFMIDTGADRSFVSDHLVGELGLPAGPPAIIFGIDGRQAVQTAALDRLRIGQREHHAIEAPVLPQGALGGSGLIGLDALAGEDVLFDFKRGQVTIAQSREEAMVGDPDIITVKGRSRFGELILTDAAIGDTKIYAIIDTGAEDSVGNLALRKLLGRSGPLESKGLMLTSVTGAALPAEAGQVPRIRLGKLYLANMEITYADIATFRKFGVADRPAMLIGMDVLRGFDRVAIDFKRRQVRFRPGAPSASETAQRE